MGGIGEEFRAKEEDEILELKRVYGRKANTQNVVKKQTPQTSTAFKRTHL